MLGVLLLAVAAVQAEWRWEAVGSVGGPGARDHAVVVWTGSELLLWGGLPFGVNRSWASDGWRYDPAGDSWRPMSSVGAPSARQFPVGVWTGRELVIWGGHADGSVLASLQTGACYDPAGDRWRPVSQVGAPKKRGDHAMVWTGSEVVVWGGYNFGAGSYPKDGGRYDPLSDSWRAVSTVGAPTPRSRLSAVWTGSEVVVWGGGQLSGGLGGTQFVHLANFGCYDPAGDRWRDGEVSGAPVARSNHAAVWTGSEMIVWGGWKGGSFEQQLLADGGRFQPDSGTWTAMSAEGAPAGRAYPASAWTGREMVVWGGDAKGSAQSGGVFDPPSGEWSMLPADGGPAGGRAGGAAWSGDAFYVFFDRLGRVRGAGPYSDDGIPDAWQELFFGPGNPLGAADRDPDRDGRSNRDEYVAGTVPTDPRSRLELTLRWLPAVAELEFRVVPAVAGRRYRLEQSPGVAPPAWSAPAGSWTDGGGGSLVCRRSLPGPGRWLFRAVVELE